MSKSRHITDKEAARINFLYRRGNSVADIADELGRDRSGISKYMLRHGLKPRERWIKDSRIPKNVADCDHINTETLRKWNINHGRTERRKLCKDCGAVFFTQEKLITYYKPII
jgi:IS30 family transposase